MLSRDAADSLWVEANLNAVWRHVSPRAALVFRLVARLADLAVLHLPSALCHFRSLPAIAASFYPPHPPSARLRSRPYTGDSYALSCP